MKWPNGLWSLIAHKSESVPVPWSCSICLTFVNWKEDDWRTEEKKMSKVWPRSSFHFAVHLPLCPERATSCTPLGRLHRLQHSSTREYQIWLSPSLLAIKALRYPAGLWFLLLVFFFFFFFFLRFICLTTQNTCSLALGRAAGDEQTGRVRASGGKTFFHYVFLWEHAAPLMSEWKTSGGSIK